MPEVPGPSLELVNEGVDWAQKSFVESNSEQFIEKVHQGYQALAEAFLSRRLQVVDLASRKGVVGLTEYGYRNNGIELEDGTFIQASQILSAAVGEQELEVPRNAPHGTQMKQVITFWAGGGGVIDKPWDTDHLDHGVMWNGGGIGLIFSPGYIPSILGVTETISTTDNSGNVHDSIQMFAIESESQILKDQRSITNPTFDRSLLITGLPSGAKGLQLTFKTTEWLRNGGRVGKDWLSHFEDRGHGRVELRAEYDSVVRLLRMGELVEFVYGRLVTGQMPRSAPPSQLESGLEVA